MQRKLTIGCQTVIDKLPIDKILAVIDGNTGKILKRGGHKIKIIIHATNARVGVETRNDWIAVFHIVHRLSEFIIAEIHRFVNEAFASQT